MFCSKCGVPMAAEANFCPKCGNENAPVEAIAALAEPVVPEETSKYMLHTGITDVVIGGILTFNGLMGQRDVASVNLDPMMTFLPGVPETYQSGTHYIFVTILGLLIAGAGLTLIIYRNNKSKAPQIIAEYAILLAVAVVFIFVSGLAVAQFFGGLQWFWLGSIFLFPGMGLHAGFKLKNV